MSGSRAGDGTAVPGVGPARQLAGQVALRLTLPLLAALTVFYWKIGPVVLTLTATHGVHLGDALAALPALATVLPMRRLRLERRLGRARPLSPNPMRRASDLAADDGQGAESAPLA